MSTLGDAARDLLLGARCLGCGYPGRAWCRPCLAEIPSTAHVVEAASLPVPARAVLPYEDAVRAAIVAHKERGAWALTSPLGDLLARALPPGTEHLTLVPVPSRRGSARRRGHDPTRALVRVAAGRRPGVQVASLLQMRAGVRDQAGLDTPERAANLDGAMWVPAGRLRRVAGRRSRVVVCDDVLTTGATLREAIRALAAVGVPVEAVAVIAATRRRRPGPG